MDNIALSTLSSTNQALLLKKISTNYWRQSSLQAYCNANWGSMDASVPKQDKQPPEQSMTALRSISGWFLMNAGAPIAWGCARHKDTAQRSCQAEVHSINETTKLILEFRLLFRDLGMPINEPVHIKNDN